MESDRRPRPHRSRRRSVRKGPALALLAALGVGCSGGGDEAAPNPDSTTLGMPATAAASDASTTAPAVTTAPTSSPVTPAATVPMIPRQPLTGVVLGEGELPIERPALAVKIDNARTARRNHRGLAVADIVFEELVEGNITRFAAVFHSQDAETVGPIRSGRSQDVDLLASFEQPLFAWSGGNPGVTSLIAASTLTDLNWQRGGRGYVRGPGAAPHNLYNDTATLWSQTPEGHPGAPPQQFDYLLPGGSFAGEPVGGVALPMGSIEVEWSWDATQARFIRSQDGQPHDDALYGRIGAVNVLVLGTWYRPSTIDARSPEAQTLTEGAPLWVFSAGRVRTGRWSRTDPLQLIRLTDDGGAPIQLTPGTTWIELAEGVATGDAANPVVDLEVLPPG